MTLNQTNSNHQLTEIYITGNTANEWFYRNQPGESELEVLSVFNVLKNSTIVLSYTVTDTSTSNTN